MSDEYPDDVIVDDFPTVWCRNGHDPKIIAERHTIHDGLFGCPECPRVFDISSESMVLDVTDKADFEGGSA